MEEASSSAHESPWVEDSDGEGPEKLSRELVVCSFSVERAEVLWGVFSPTWKLPEEIKIVLVSSDFEFCISKAGQSFPVLAVGILTA